MNQIEKFPLMQRLALLRDIMQRDDLSATAKNLCWLLLVERTNRFTGECTCSNTHIAKQLAIGLASVKRAKAELRETKLLDTSTPAQNEPTSKNRISSYRFIYRFVAQNEPTQTENMSRAQNEPRLKTSLALNQKSRLKMSPQQNQTTFETIAIDNDGPEAILLRKAGIVIPPSRTGKFHYRPGSKPDELLRQAQQHTANAPRAHALSAAATPQPAPTDDAEQFQQWKTAFASLPKLAT